MQISYNKVNQFVNSDKIANNQQLQIWFILPKIALKKERKELLGSLYEEIVNLAELHYRSQTERDC